MQLKRTHRILDLPVVLLACFFIAAAFVSCEETCYDGKLNNQEEAVDCGGPCVPCDTTGGTCFDGTQNQGEEGVDCGGPCPACITDSTVLSPDFICEGTGGSAYLPLASGSYWIYAMPGQGWFQLEIVGSVTQGNGQDYFHMATSGDFSGNNYYRSEAGAVYEWSTSTSMEDIFIPANPVAGFSWTTSTGDSIVIESIDASVNSQNGCQYDGLLQRVAYSAGGGQSTRYYKRGLGMVDFPSVNAHLDSAVVY